LRLDPPPIRALVTVTAKRGLNPAYPVRTARLDLRPHRRDDLEDLLAFHSQPEVVRYVPWPVRDREQTRIALETKLGQGVVTEPGQWLVLAMEMRHTSSVIGEVLLKWESETSRQGEVGFAVHTAYQGRGFAAEAARAVLRLGFNDLGLHRIVAVCIDANADSVRLLRRLGMHQEAHLRDNVFFKGEWADQLVFGVLEDEWRRNEQVAPRDRDCFERNYQRRRRNAHGRQS
jgi:RimJ/RimL family protein N-acetyltransferase